jgi:hypothetical protein
MKKIGFKMALLIFCIALRYSKSVRRPNPKFTDTLYPNIKPAIKDVDTPVINNKKFSISTIIT